MMALRPHPVAALALSALLSALLLSARADEPRPAQAAQPTRPAAGTARLPAADGTAVRIVLVEWKIKKGREQDFLDYWSKRATVADRAGLITEFLASPDSTERWPWINWPTPIARPDYTLFYNIGLWRDDAAFQEQVGRFIDPERPALDFEAEKRSRILLAPQRWRAGATSAPQQDSAQTQ